MKLDINDSVDTKTGQVLSLNAPKPHAHLFPLSFSILLGSFDND